MPDFPLNVLRLPMIDIAVSLTLVLLLLVVRMLAGHAIRSRAEMPLHLQRRWAANVRNALLLLGLVGLVLIWAPQLRTLALSLTAVAVAVVIATKELILCFSGAFMRTSSGSFTVGDWIEVAGARGEVVDHNLFVTVLHEFQPGTFNHSGRKVVLPNSLFLGQAMRNDSLMREVALHSFSLTLDQGLDLAAHRGPIEALVAARCAPVREAGQQAIATIGRRLHAELNDEPLRIDFRTTDLGKIRIVVTVLCPPRQAESLENDITCSLLAYLHAVTPREAPASPAGGGAVGPAAAGA